MFFMCALTVSSEIEPAAAALNASSYFARVRVVCGIR
jgi:hypothetical protein